MPAIHGGGQYILVRVTRLGARPTALMGVHIYGPGAGRALPGWRSTRGGRVEYANTAPAHTERYTDAHSQLRFRSYAICVAGVNTNTAGVIPPEVMDYIRVSGHFG